MICYPPELEAEMRAFYDSLSEKDRRRYAAIEARNPGPWRYNCDRHSPICELQLPHSDGGLFPESPSAAV